MNLLQVYMNLLEVYTFVWTYNKYMYLLHITSTDI